MELMGLATPGERCRLGVGGDYFGGLAATPFSLIFEVISYLISSGSTKRQHSVI